MPVVLTGTPGRYTFRSGSREHLIAHLCASKANQLVNLDMRPPFRVIGVGFDHMHIGDQLRTALEHPQAELVGVTGGDAARVDAVCGDLGLDLDADEDLDQLVARANPEIAFVCSTTAEHANWVERLAAAGVHCILEKPFADSATNVDRMIQAASQGGIALTVNWPLAWVASHRTTKRLIDAGAVGEVCEVHFYDGNRGPLRHDHGKKELAESAEAKRSSWWYSKAAGGGSMRDYLGYGTTLATWFRDGATPDAITASWHLPAGLEVDEQSVVVAEYDTGLSVFETRWGTLSDPWTRQPLPRCGFVVGGSEGSIASWDYAETVALQLADGSEAQQLPVDSPAPEDRSALANLIAHLDRGRPLDPPMTAEISRTGHLMVEAAVASAERGARVPFEEAW